MKHPGVVVATIRPDSFKVWIDAWGPEFKAEEAELFIMHDAEAGDPAAGEIQKAAAKWLGPIGYQYLNHDHVKRTLGPKNWIIPKRTSACKSFGIYRAWQAKKDPIIVLDDDCLPAEESGYLIKGHIENMDRLSLPHVQWTMSTRPRGVPYLPAVEVVVSHGLWRENVDLDAIVLLSDHTAPLPEETKLYGGTINFGSLFPMCGMNLAFKQKVAPLMYFGLQGPDWGVDRFDDIWCGFIAKKILDESGLAVYSGRPFVRHVRASDPFVNIVKEAPGYKMNCELYGAIRKAHFWSMQGASDFLIDFGSKQKTDYWQRYGEAIQVWAELFKED